MGGARSEERRRRKKEKMKRRNETRDACHTDPHGNMKQANDSLRPGQGRPHSARCQGGQWGQGERL